MVGKEEESLRKHHDDSSASDSDKETGERSKLAERQMITVVYDDRHTPSALETTDDSSNTETNRDEEPDSSQTTAKKRVREAIEDSTDTNEPIGNAAQSQQSESFQVRLPSHLSTALSSQTDDLIRRNANHPFRQQNISLPQLGITNPMLASLTETQRQAITLLTSLIPGLGTTGRLDPSLLPQLAYLHQSATNLQNYLHQSAVASTRLNQILMGQQIGLGNTPNWFPRSAPGVVSRSFPLGTNPLQSRMPVVSQVQHQAVTNAANAELRPQKRQRTEGGPPPLPRVLALAEDNSILSAHQIFLRYQIEAFSASGEDVSTHTRGRNKPVTLGQVGIRCRYCAHLPVGQRQKGSTYFPASLLGLYQAAQNMCSTHLQSGLCNKMPLEVRQQFVQLLSSKISGSGSGRPYWARAATKLGLVDTEDGIRLDQHFEVGDDEAQSVLAKPSRPEERKDFQGNEN